jgi:pimeloyl-ACP methyl ester carboxylesterase
MRASAAAPPTVSARWLLTAASVAISAAAACAWGALCLLFWQGSWQLLYHPAAAVTRTPASVGLGFDSIGFATTEAGQARLQGWWIPAAPGARYEQYTVLCLHGQNGNLGDTVDALAALHNLGLNVFAIDYRGYGQSKFERPSEARWKEDASWALEYLTATRHVAAGAILLDGKDLGANLALELAAEHAELGGVILETPLAAPADAIFNDPRARLVPARWLVRDRFSLDAAATRLRIPSLWLEEDAAKGHPSLPEPQEAPQRVTSRKTVVWLAHSLGRNSQVNDALARWLDDLPSAGR